MTTAHVNKFSKSEKLCNIKEISSLFKGESLFVYPFKIAYSIKSESITKPEVKILCSVGKRYHKSAVKRNLIKRRTREAYRLNKNILYSKLIEKNVSIAFIYISQKEESYEQIHKSITKSLHKITELL